MRKIKIESHGISPWHYHLENMSWGFCRGKAESDNIMEYLNVPPCHRMESISFVESQCFASIGWRRWLNRAAGADLCRRLQRCCCVCTDNHCGS